MFGCIRVVVMFLEHDAISRKVYVLPYAVPTARLEALVNARDCFYFSRRIYQDKLTACLGQVGGEHKYCDIVMRYHVHCI